jgi:hypothetical protein
MGNGLKLVLYSDGSTLPDYASVIIEAIKSTWKICYSKYIGLDINEGFQNIKKKTVLETAPAKVKLIAGIRNPDLYFVEETRNVILGGIEATNHTPDGSNATKRYPYLWISRKENANAIHISPYSKRRPSGQVNKLTGIIAEHNKNLLSEWNCDDSSLIQYLIIRELQENDVEIPKTLDGLIFSLNELGVLFAHLLAVQIFKTMSIPKQLAKSELEKVKARLKKVAEQILAESSGTVEPSTALETEKRLIIVYNCRPDTGHWERGEGQFDSIDGRIMFQLDRMDLSKKEKDVEFWMPQFSSNHPWVLEQKKNQYGSKRFRNIIVELSKHISVKFCEDLSEDDWALLSDNPKAVLERLDWTHGIYSAFVLTEELNRKSIAEAGLMEGLTKFSTQILSLLKADNLFFSTHRCYSNGWRNDLVQRATKLPHGSTLLLPRIPENKVPTELLKLARIKIVPAGKCTKYHMLMIRQLNRARLNR